MTPSAHPGTGAVAAQLWQPCDALVTDVRHTLAIAPRQTPEDRFEAWREGFYSRLGTPLPL